MKANVLLLIMALALPTGGGAQDAVVQVTAPRLYAGEVISIDFQNVSVRAALHMLADASVRSRTDGVPGRR